MVGQTLGQYKIQEELGAGGMGVVYRGSDSKLGRDVAIKVLPAAFAKDPDRLVRFEREARFLASLNHPNIAAIHGLQEADGVPYLVLEYVAGETLAQRLARGPLEIREALGVCRQIAEALEEAHNKGIVHRDLKPGNVMITPAGKVKVLDFGLAKAFQAESSCEDLSQSPTITAESVSQGKIMGTAAYMSPEQARGKPLDKRTDIWSFGCVLYEALSRKRAFAGQTISDSIAAVLTREPDWQAPPETTPPAVRTLLRRCLQKDPQRRMRDIGDAQIELEEALAGPSQAAAADAPAGHPARYPILTGVLCTVAGALLVGLVGWNLRPKQPLPVVARFSVSLPQGEILQTTSNSIAISPDGTRVAFAANRDGRTQVYLRQIGQLEIKPIQGTLGGVAPIFSYDGQWLAFHHVASRTFKKVALSGGAPVTMFPYEAGGDGSWERDDTIIYHAQYPGAILRTASTGGATKALTRLEVNKEEKVHTCPQLLPGGKALLFTSVRAGMETYDDARIEAQILSTGERRVLIEGGVCGQYSSTGHLVYARSGTLLAVAFDPQRLIVTGSPVPVLEGVSMGLATGSAQFALSASGTLAYGAGSALGGNRTVVWVDRHGNVERLSLPPRSYLHPRLSPDGRRIAIEVEGPTHDFYIYELERGVLTRMTLDGSNHWPVWTPDGGRISFRIWGPGGFTMWWMPADRSSAPERLTTVGIMQSPASWSPDGKLLAFTQVSPDTGADVFVLPLDDPQRKPIPFAQSKFAEGSPRFSPDGRWIAYTSNESGRNEIYVQSYPGPGPKIQISTEGGSDAVWKPDGEELYYRNRTKMMAAAVKTKPAFLAGAPRMLWEGVYAEGTSSACGPPGPTSSNYDISAKGERFLMIKDSETDSVATQVNVILNWSEELKRLMNSRK
jgi:serine/threonine-protein kinase